MAYNLMYSFISQCSIRENTVKKKKKTWFETDGFENLDQINQNSAKNFFLSFSACLVHLPLCIFTQLTTVVLVINKKGFVGNPPRPVFLISLECAI